MLGSSPAPSGQRTVVFGPAVRFDVDLSDNESFKELFFFQYQPPALSAILDAILRPGDCFVDVGANLGVYTLWAARLVGAEGLVLAFEPVPTINRLLRSNLELNDVSNTEVVDVALGATDGSVRLSVPKEHLGLASARPRSGDVNTFEVPLTSLDSFMSGRQNPTLIKIDVEGYEYQVLRGMDRVLSQTGPVLIIEVVDEHLQALGSSSRQVLRTLLDHGYELWNLTTSGLQTVSLDRPTTANVLATRPDAHDIYVERLGSARFFRNQVT